MVYRRLLHRRADSERDRRTRSARVTGKNSAAATEDKRTSEAHADSLPPAEAQEAGRKTAPCASSRKAARPSTLTPVVRQE